MSLCEQSYLKLVKYEAQLLMKEEETEANTQLKIVSIRVLAFTLRQTMSLEGIKSLALSIKDADDSGLSDLGLLYLIYFISAFYRHFERGRAPSPGPPARLSKSAFDDKHQLHNISLMQSGNLDFGAARELVMQRDDRRDNIARDYGKDDPRPEAIDHCFTTMQEAQQLVAVHIIPERLLVALNYLHKENEHVDVSSSMDSQKDCPPNVVNQESTMRTMLQCIGGVSEESNITSSLSGNKIHSPENLLLLRQNDHDSFSRFLLWFEPIVCSCIHFFTSHLQ